MEDDDDNSFLDDNAKQLIAAEEARRWEEITEHCANCIVDVQNCNICRKLYGEVGRPKRYIDPLDIAAYHGGLHAFNRGDD